jgi:hypothetical protein
MVMHLLSCSALEFLHENKANKNDGYKIAGYSDPSVFNCPHNCIERVINGAPPFCESISNYSQPVPQSSYLMYLQAERWGKSEL